MFKFDESMYGKQVRFINAKAHEEMPEYYPKVGTIGILIPTKDTNFKWFADDYAVQWPKGSTAGTGTDCWLVDEESLELVKEVVDKP